MRHSEELLKKRRRDNRKCLKVLRDYMDNNPDLRFSQVLLGTGLIATHAPNPIINASVGLLILNDFYLEPEDLLKRAIAFIGK